MISIIIIIVIIIINDFQIMIFISYIMHSASHASLVFPVRGCGSHAHLLFLPFERPVIAVSYSIAACLALCVCAYIVPECLG